MNYLDFLNHGYKQTIDFIGDCSRLEYAANCVFNIWTYDGEMDEIFAKKAIEVAVSISKRETFSYIINKEDYKWFLIMCHMSFFAKRISWGISIRGAFWDSGDDGIFELDSYGFFEGDRQMDDPLKFNINQWNEFILSLDEFIKQ